MRALVDFCLFLVIIGCCHAMSRIISRPEDISVYVGQAAMFRCQISNPQDGVASWSSVTSNYTILQGSQLLASDATKFSLKSAAGGQMYNLQILNIEKSDQGFYRCAIEGIDQQIISQLTVLETLPSQPTSVSAVALCDTASGSILLRWSEPTKNPEKVTGFNIMYKPSNQETYNSVLLNNSKAFEYLLENVLADTNYLIHISATADDGVSSESSELEIYVPYCTFPVNESTVAIVSTTAFTRGTDRETVILESTTALATSTKEDTSILDTYSTLAPTGSTSRLDDILNDDRLVKVAIGVGVTMCIICLVAIIILAVFFVHRSRSQSFMLFENPSFRNSEAVKLQAAYDNISSDKKLKEAQGILYI